jgi:hypothetical protein
MLTPTILLLLLLDIAAAATTTVATTSSVRRRTQARLVLQQQQQQQRSCKTDLDCSLAGMCRGGVCHCQSWTKGPDCSELNIVPPATPAAVVAAVQPAGNWTRWGSSVVEDADGQFHLFSAEMADECPLSVWGFKSTVIHSVSASPTGPFHRLGIAIPAEAHNPVISRAVDGTWLIWTCGCPNPNAPPGCARHKHSCSGGQEAAWTTTVYSSQSLDGPW